MRPSDVSLARELEEKLDAYNRDVRPLPGLSDPREKACLIKQLIDSVRRIRYVTTIVNSNRLIDPRRADPASEIFDPLYAAVMHKRAGNLDEAFWLVFLSTQFAGSKLKGWPLCQAVYQRLDFNGAYWTWDRASQDPEALSNWIASNATLLKARGSFGNHKKYATLKSTGTGRTVVTYVEMIGSSRSHSTWIEKVSGNRGSNPKEKFRLFYEELESVFGFGRLGKFDFLTMVGKIGLAPIVPDSPYIPGATGPLSGAKKLFGAQNEKSVVLDQWLQELEPALGVYFGMQVLEDALCNWQKSPKNYVYFNG